MGSVSDILPLSEVKPGRIVQTQDLFQLGVVMKHDGSPRLKVLRVADGVIDRWPMDLPVRQIDVVALAEEAALDHKRSEQARILLAAFMRVVGPDEMYFTNYQLEEASRGRQFDVLTGKDGTTIRLVGV